MSFARLLLDNGCAFRRDVGHCGRFRSQLRLPLTRPLVMSAPRRRAGNQAVSCTRTCRVPHSRTRRTPRRPGGQAVHAASAACRAGRCRREGGCVRVTPALRIVAVITLTCRPKPALNRVFVRLDLSHDVFLELLLGAHPLDSLGLEYVELSMGLSSSCGCLSLPG